MKYYLIVVNTNFEGEATKKAIYEYPTEIDAKAAYHSQISAVMKDANIAKAFFTIFDTEGLMYCEEVHIKEQPNKEKR